MGRQSIDVTQQLVCSAPLPTTSVQQGGQVAQMAAMEQRTRDLHDKAAFPLKEMFQQLTNEWNNFVTAIAKGDFVKHLVEAQFPEVEIRGHLDVESTHP
ncbi:MAG: hypothetical protein WDN25_28425 [Acetobacteraceae bacterium]